MTNWGRSQTEIVQEIKQNLASLKTSVDKIVQDMDSIRKTRKEILDKFDSLKTDNNSAQIQATLVKAKSVMRKSEENHYKLELVQKKVNFIRNFTNISGPLDLLNNETTKVFNEKNKQIKNQNNNNEEEMIHLQILNNNNDINAISKSNKNAKDMKVKCDSALKELQWIVKIKLYRMRHRRQYERLSYEHDLGEKTPLVLRWP